MLSKQSFQPLILSPHLIALSRGVGVQLFQAKNFLLEGLDILLFALTMGTEWVSKAIDETVALYLPLRLTIELLSPGHGWLAVRLGPSSLGRLAICRCISLLVSDLTKSQCTFCLLLFSSQLVQERNVAQRALFTGRAAPCEYYQHRLNDSVSWIAGPK